MGSRVLALAVTAQPAAVPEDVAAAALRYATSGRSGEMVICIEVDGRDPSPPVLAAAQQSTLKVVPGSECTRVVDTKRGSRHVATNRKAVFVNVWGYRAGQEGYVYVEVTDFHHGLWGGSRTYALRRSPNGSWLVQEASLNRVS